MHRSFFPVLDFCLIVFRQQKTPLQSGVLKILILGWFL